MKEVSVLALGEINSGGSKHVSGGGVQGGRDDITSMKHKNR